MCYALFYLAFHYSFATYWSDLPTVTRAAPLDRTLPFGNLGCRKTHAWLANYYVSCTNTLRVLQQSCGSLKCALRLSYVFQKTQTNRKENEHVENLLRQPCDLVFRTAVLRCCSQHRVDQLANLCSVILR